MSSEHRAPNQEVDWCRDVYRVLKEAGVGHVAYVPDARYATAMLGNAS